MEEASFRTPLHRKFTQLEEFARMPDESTILRFRHRLEEHKRADHILITVNDLLTATGLLLKVGILVVPASLAMVCMIFIAHTIPTHQSAIKMGCPAAYDAMPELT